MDLSPERLVTKPMRALRVLRESGVAVDMAWDAGSWSPGGARRLRAPLCSSGAARFRGGPRPCGASASHGSSRPAPSAFAGAAGGAIRGPRGSWRLSRSGKGPVFPWVSCLFGVRLCASERGSLPDDEAAVEGKLRVRKAKGLLRDPDGHATELEEDGARLDDGHVVLDRALALAHAHLGGLLRDGLVGEDADPELALALEVARDRHAGGLDLLAAKRAAGERLQHELTEHERVAALGVARAGALLRLAVLGECGGEGHVNLLLGLSVSLRTRPSGGVGLLLADPALDADLAVHGLGLGESVVDVLAQGVERNPALALPFAARDVGAAEAARALDLDALGSERHRHLDRLLHGPPEGDPALELEGDVFRDELGLDLGLLDLLDVEQDLLARQLDELGLDVLDLLSLAPDDDAGPGGVDLDADAVGRALDEDARHGGLLELLHQGRADQVGLEKELRELLLAREPAGLPVAPDGQSEADRICFLAHGLGWVGVAVREDDADVRHLL